MFIETFIEINKYSNTSYGKSGMRPNYHFEKKNALKFKNLICTYAQVFPSSIKIFVSIFLNSNIIDNRGVSFSND